MKTLLIAGAAVMVLVGLTVPSDIAFAQQLTVLYSFCSQQNCIDGSRPAAGLTIDGRGVLYGTTNVGGASNNGTVFKLTPTTGIRDRWTETVLYSFCSLSNCTDGYNPAFRLLIDHHGILYGTTPYGGTYRGGTVFKLTPPTGNSRQGRWTETVLYSFCALSNCTDGVDPQGDLIMDQHGALLGATEGGPINSFGGTVFKLTPPAPGGGPWTETVLYTFCSMANCIDGASPRAGLLMDERGALYGTTQVGDTQRPQGGTVFKLTPPSVKGGAWIETVLYKFCSKTACLDGAAPQANLIMDEQGALIGTTFTGGSRNQGTVFKLTPPTVTGGPWTETVLYSFCSMTNCTDGAVPVSGLIMGKHGALFGTTSSGGYLNGGGTVFKLTPPTTAPGQWTETVLYRFCSPSNCADGFQPNADLIMDSRGALYGTTNSGGSNGGGTVFKLIP